MKKILAIMLILVMVFSFGLTGCSSKADSASSGAVATQSSYPDPSTMEKVKIGVLWYGWTDQLSLSIKKNLDYIGKEFNVEFMYTEALSPEAAISETQNMIQSDCKGIISIFIYADMIKQCDKAGVYLAEFCNGTTDPEILQAEKDSKYFVGIVNENDEACGEATVNDLYQRGCRNIVWLSAPAGLAANHDNRVRGIETALKTHPDMNVLSSYRGMDAASAMETFAVTYKKMDGIILTGGAGGNTESFYQVMTSEGLTERGVLLATFDIGEGTGDRLKSGDLAWIAGGQFATSGIAFTLVYNAITGNKILDDPTQVLDRNFMILQSYEDYGNYVKYVEGDMPPYTGDELKALIVSLNNGKTVDDIRTLYKQYSDNYSIADVVARHSDLVK